MKTEKEKMYGRSHYGTDHEHHRRPSGDRGGLRRNHRAGVPRHAREVHPQPRSRFGQVALRAVVVASIAIATALGLAFIPSAAQAATSLTPPPATDALPVTSIPACSAIAPNYQIGPDTNAATQLGWGPGKPSMVVYPGSYAVQFTPMIPCSEADYMSVYLRWNVISGTPPSGTALTNLTLTMSCVSGAGVQSDYSRSDSAGINANVQGIYAGAYVLKTLSSCGRITKIALSLCSGYPGCDNNTPPLNAVWVPRQWNTSDSGFAPATTVGQVLGAGTELPIICRIDNSGGDIFQVTQNVVASIVNWVPCMLIPVGWDRAAMIPSAWQTGPVGQLTSAFRASVPNGIACGPVGEIPFYGRVVGLDTCGADFAPGYVKTVVGWVIVLGVCALIVRRIMWAVGSRA